MKVKDCLCKIKDDVIIALHQLVTKFPSSFSGYRGIVEERNWYKG